jgi:class 3 adenylate cyclase
VTGPQPRKLAAILAADIGGYSALMGADEDTTVQELKALQATILPMIPTFGGRIIDTAGDGILAEFSSVLNALKCGLAIQEKARERNATAQPSRQMKFRIGINQGDVVFDDTRLYGDGVNVAARLEAIAEPGRICVSGKVFDEVRGKIDVEFANMGEQRLKNIAEPVRVTASLVLSHRRAGGNLRRLPVVVYLPDWESRRAVLRARSAGVSFEATMCWVR